VWVERFVELCDPDGFSSPFIGEVGRGIGVSKMSRFPIPTLALPLKGREYSAAGLHSKI
jgi:hypothetical protein